LRKGSENLRECPWWAKFAAGDDGRFMEGLKVQGAADRIERNAKLLVPKLTRILKGWRIQLHDKNADTVLSANGPEKYLLVRRNGQIDFDIRDIRDDAWLIGTQESGLADLSEDAVDLAAEKIARIISAFSISKSLIIGSGRLFGEYSDAVFIVRTWLSEKTVMEFKIDPSFKRAIVMMGRFRMDMPRVGDISLDEAIAMAEQLRGSKNRTSVAKQILKRLARGQATQSGVQETRNGVLCGMGWSREAV